MSEFNVRTSDSSRRSTSPGRRWAFSLRAVCAVTLGAVLVVSLVFWLRDRSPRADGGLIERLRSDDPEERKRAAWRVADRGEELVADLVLRPQLEDNGETSADVRESYTYALGRLGAPRFADTLEMVVRADESGYVRAAAWLALARCAPERFRQLAGSQPTAEDPWDQIGVAQGWAQLGDSRGLDDLLHWAAGGGPNQRLVAARALLRSLRPVLEAVGRWPIEADPRPGEAWSAELVAEVRERCRGLDVDGVSAGVRARFEAAARVRRDVGRLTGARERAARLLFSP